MIGGKIKELRLKEGMTQKNLADKLFVSAQAVSRWENNEVEPSIGTIMELAKIFNVTTDEMLGINADKKNGENNTYKNNESPKAPEKEYVYKEVPKQHLAVCEKCNHPIYEPENLIRTGSNIICRDCKRKEENLHRQKVLYKAKKRRILSFIIPTIVSAFLLISVISVWNTVPVGIEAKIYAIVFSVSMFPFISCCLLANNFVGDMALEIMSWGFVRMPMLIFEFSVDGCLWFIGVKIILWILGFLLASFTAFLAAVIGGIVSFFVYPYAIIKNIKHPEKTELF